VTREKPRKYGQFHLGNIHRCLRVFLKSFNELYHNETVKAFEAIMIFLREYRRPSWYIPTFLTHPKGTQEK
jgi:hypothetical protein